MVINYPLLTDRHMIYVGKNDAVLTPYRVSIPIVVMSEDDDCR